LKLSKDVVCTDKVMIRSARGGFFFLVVVLFVTFC